MKSSSSRRTVEVELRSVDLALDLCSSPLAEPHLHPELATAISERAGLYDPNAGFRMVLFTPPDEVARESEVATALQAHFRREGGKASAELRETIASGRSSLVIGMLFVAALALLSEWLQSLGDARGFRLLGESLIIIGWVTLWIPVETLIFARFPIRRRLRMFQALAESEVVLTAKTADRSVSP